MIVKLMSLFRKQKKSSPFQNCSMAPRTGLEPVTSWLTVMRSTDWAIEECRRLLFTSDIYYSTKISNCQHLFEKNLNYFFNLVFAGIFASFWRNSVSNGAFYFTFAVCLFNKVVYKSTRLCYTLRSVKFKIRKFIKKQNLLQTCPPT